MKINLPWQLQIKQCPPILWRSKKSQRLVNDECRLIARFLGSRLDSNVWKGVASCNIRGVVVETLGRIDGELRKGELMRHLREQLRKFKRETLFEQ